MLERAGLVEQMGGARYHDDLALGRDRRLCLPVELKDISSRPPTINRGGAHFAQRLARKIRAAAARRPKPLP